MKADWSYTGLSTESCLGAALDYSWSMEYPKETSIYAVIHNDFLCAKLQIGSPSTLSISSASRTPSPSVAAATSAHPPGPSFNTVSSSSAPTDVYSRKVFVGGLPPDIDEGKCKEEQSCHVHYKC